LLAFALRLSKANDVNMFKKLGLFAAFAAPTVLVFWLIQRIARYRIPWLVELFALPFAVGGLVYAFIGLRDVLKFAAT
jgi:hypothetical protein